MNDFGSSIVRLLIAIAWLVMGSDLALGQSHRDRLPIPHHELIRGMYEMAKHGELVKLEKTLDLARPLSERLKSQSGIDLDETIRNALASGNSRAAYRGVVRFVVYDMYDLMSIATEQASTQPAQGRTDYNKAHFLYTLLSEEVRQRDFAADQRIKRAFRESILSFPKTASTVDGAPLEQSRLAIEKQSHAIRAELDRILLPDSKGSVP